MSDMWQHLLSWMQRWSSYVGQSILEFALILPILLIMIAGLVEVGVYANDYLTFLDATREAARYASNLDPYLTSKYPFDERDDSFPDVQTMTAQELDDVCMYGDTVNFYYVVSCLAFQNIPLGWLDPSEGDDIVITVAGYLPYLPEEHRIQYRWPLPEHRNGPDDPPAADDWEYHFKQDPNCWSLFGVRKSAFSDADIEALLRSDAPASALVIVEVFHAHYQFTRMFTIGDFIPDPIQIHPYSIFPVPAAEPTPTVQP